MGTSSLICVIYEGHLRIAHFSRFDGYPDSHGHGMRILRFLRRPGKIERLAQGLQHVSVPDARGVEDLDIVAMDETAISLARMRVTLSTAVPSFYHERGARILKVIARASSETPLRLDLDIELATDSQWVYLLDLDRRTFEVFTGVPKTRFERVPYQDIGGDLFFPPQVATFRFEALPDTETEFIGQIKEGAERRVLASAMTSSTASGEASFLHWTHRNGLCQTLH